MPTTTQLLVDGLTRRPRRGRTVIAMLVALLIGLVAGFGVMWLNPFGDKIVDRSQPVLLQSIKDLSRYTAASGNFQVIVDLEKDATFLPDALKGERTLFVGAGSVDAFVDFGGLGADSITVSPDRTSVTVRLPPAQLEPTRLDGQRSYVVAQQRGIVDRINDFFSGNPNRQQELYVLAEKKIQEAAQASGLRNRADQNTKMMLENMLRSLGFTKVTVTIAGQP